MIRNLLIAGVMAFGLSTTALADNIGKPLPESQIEGFTQSPATSLDELTGRAILIEFFAYW
ncbi:MAG: hypothetical protein ACI9X4_000382 [Glaciecola sp.]|jgi:hypothetical protein